MDRHARDSAEAALTRAPSTARPCQAIRTPMLLSRDVPLAPLTTLRLGGNAAHAATATDEAELVEALHEADSRGDDVFVLGGGSNVVVADEGFGGLVVRIASRGIAIERRGSKILLDVAAGEDWDALVGAWVEEGYSGIESLAGIPGLVGATPIQNVGAYGHEVSETLVRVRAFDRQEQRFVEIDNADCAFGYRTSMFRGKGRYVVVRVAFELGVTSLSAPVHYAELARALGVKEGERAPAKEVRRAVLELRRSKGMVLDPNDPDSVSAGSFFVNPTLSREELEGLEQRVRGWAAPFRSRRNVVDRLGSASALAFRRGTARGRAACRASTRWRS